jgi:hypothetical protein
VGCCARTDTAASTVKIAIEAGKRSTPRDE